MSNIKQPTRKDLIVKAIENMDISMLDVLLDDDKIYSETTKAIFLRKLNDVFENEFKSEGDIFLNTHKGGCPVNGCYKCGGFRFEGNHSKNRIDLIFKEKEGDVIDIKECHDFKMDNPPVREKKNGEYDDELEEDYKMGYTRGGNILDIKEDEKVNFVPTISYSIKQEKCQSALDELFQYEIIDKEIYSYWLKKHEILHKTFIHSPVGYFTQNKFYKLYYILKAYYNP